MWSHLFYHCSACVLGRGTFGHLWDDTLPVWFIGMDSRHFAVWQMTFSCAWLQGWVSGQQSSGGIRPAPRTQGHTLAAHPEHPLSLMNPFLGLPTAGRACLGFFPPWFPRPHQNTSPAPSVLATACLVEWHLQAVEQRPRQLASHSIMLSWLFNSTEFTFLESDTIRQPWGLSSLLPKLDPTQLGALSQVPLRLCCSYPVSGARREVGGVLLVCPSPCPWGFSPGWRDTWGNSVCLGSLPSSRWRCPSLPKASITGSSFSRANLGLFIFSPVPGGTVSPPPLCCIF